MKKYLLTLVIFHSLISEAQQLKEGKWKGEIKYNEAVVPFDFEVTFEGKDLPVITFKNGDETIIVDHTQVKGDTLIIPLLPFDVQIKATFSAMSMHGSYIKNYRGSTYSFRAFYGKKRFERQSINQPVFVDPRWKVTFSPNSSSESKGVGLLYTEGSTITGTFLTEVSDYRFFEGIVDGDSIKMSSFDGAHAFLFRGKRQNNQWQGELIFDSGQKEDWVAIPDTQFELRDPWSIVTLEKGVHTPYYDLLGAGSGLKAVNPENYVGKVLIIQLFGTWCPNSLDQTKYLVKWAKSKPDNVEILASSYEANYTKKYGLSRIETYKLENDINYDVVLGGKLSKQAAAMSFPFMRKIEAFPTLIFVDKKGYARYVCSYFNGPATGSYHHAFDQKFREVIQILSNE